MQKRIFVLILLFLLACIFVAAQTATSRINGFVTDPSGAVIPGVRVTATHEQTGVSYDTVTTDQGVYVFDAVLPGPYRIDAELPGFKKLSSPGNVVTANRVHTLNIRLEVGEVSQVVEVQGSYQGVQTTQSGNIGTIVNEKTIVNLPLNGRNPLDLVALNPGINQGANTGGGTHVNGARDRAINITLDGIDANETSAGTATFTPIRTNPDSLQEYRVITSNASAEFGRNSGAIITLVTKSGTNHIHGSVYEFHRNRVLNANEWSLNQIGEKRRFLLRNQFGFDVGGPIFKDRTFWFFNYEGQTQVQTLQQTNTVYTELARKGIFRYVVGGRNNPAGAPGASVDLSGNPLPGVNIGTYDIVANDPRKQGLDPSIQKWLGLTTLPNRFDFGDGLNTAGFSFLARRVDPQRNFNLRVDHTFNEKHSIYGRYSWGRQDTDGDTTNDGAARFPGLPDIVRTGRTPRNLAIGLRSNFTPRIVNELIVGGNHFGFTFRNPNPDFPNILPWHLGNVTDPLDNYFGNERRINTFQIVDSISWVRGGHTVKSGINFRYQQHYDIRGSVAGLDVQPIVNFSPSINFVDPAVFNIPSNINQSFDLGRLQTAVNELLGRVGSMSQAFVFDGGNGYLPPGSAFTIDARWGEYDFFIQDDWKLSPRLTLNLGLREEIKNNPRDRIDDRIFIPNTNINACSSPSFTLKWVRGDIFDNDVNNWAPSIGIAWDPRGDGKMSVRANYHIAYDRLSTFLPSSAVFPTVPGITLGVINQSFGQAGGRIRDGLPVLAPPAGATPESLSQPAPKGTGSISVFDHNFVAPVTQMWGLSIQKELPKKFVAEVNYLGRKADHLIGGYDVNQVELYGNGFLDAFKVVKAGGDSPLFNQLLAKHPSVRTGESGSQFARRFFSSSFSLNSVASLASTIDNTLVGGKGLPEVAGLSPFFFRRYPQFSGGLFVFDSNDYSNYHAFQATLSRHFAEGLELQANYTFGKSLDLRSYDPTFTQVASGATQSASSTPQDYKRRYLNYARSDFDRTHIFTADTIYELPLGHNKRLLGGANPVVDKLVSGWQIAAIVTLESGYPLTIYGGSNTLNNRVQSFANFNGDFHTGGLFLDQGTGRLFYLNDQERAQFTAPGAGETGQARNAIAGAPFRNLDFSLIKKTTVPQLGDQGNLEFRAEFFNALNHLNFHFLSSAIITSSLFGRVSGTENSARLIQLGLKLNF